MRVKTRKVVVIYTKPKALVSGGVRLMNYIDIIISGLLTDLSPSSLTKVVGKANIGYIIDV